jgi:hypothetical protein
MITAELLLMRRVYDKNLLIANALPEPYLSYFEIIPLSELNSTGKGESMPTSSR